MGRYTVIFSKKAVEQARIIRDSYPESAKKRLQRIVRELEDHPFTGIGKPEALRGIPLWSRRLTQKDRVTYRVAQDVVEVLVLTCLGHYDDK